MLGGVEALGDKERTLLARLSLSAPPAPGFALRLACLCKVEGPCQVYLPHNEAVVLEKGDGEMPAYDGGQADALGFAVDIGTTTVALRLYDLPRGEVLASRSALNAQGAFGADVLSRIAHADKNGHQTLHRPLVGQLDGMMREALAEANRPAAQVERLVITGNTTMLHFAAGLDPHGIGIFPFTPETYFGSEQPASTLFPFLPAQATLYFPRCISAYVGADMVCGLLACGFDGGGDDRLLIDVGTNGEMALMSQGRLLCCATAAGPAFEGAQISMGMTAANGAIRRVAWQDGQMQYETIGEGPARGICGTGLIGAIRSMLACGALDITGLLADEDAEDFAIADSGVTISGKDIREVQLAKAAIAAGTDALLEAAGLSEQAVAEVLLAGGFGSTIDPEDAAGIGLISAAFVRKTRAVGNVALSGAAMMLMSKACRAAASALAERAEEVPLATNGYFMDRYMEQMMFPEGEG